MKILEILTESHALDRFSVKEGAKLPGANKGIAIMSPEEFVSKSDDQSEEEEGVAEGIVDDMPADIMVGTMDKIRRDADSRRYQHLQNLLKKSKKPETIAQIKALLAKEFPQGVAEARSSDEFIGQMQKLASKKPKFAIGNFVVIDPNETEGYASSGMIGKIVELYNNDGEEVAKIALDGATGVQKQMKLGGGVFGPSGATVSLGKGIRTGGTHTEVPTSILQKYEPNMNEQGVAEGAPELLKAEMPLVRHIEQELEDKGWKKSDDGYDKVFRSAMAMYRKFGNVDAIKKNAVNEDQEQLSRIRKLSGLNEAIKLPAPTREFDPGELQDLATRIIGKPDLDKEGKPKLDKKGKEKYISGKTKLDRYKYPYIHRSSVIEYLGPDGKTLDEDKIKQTLATRPKALLKQNVKMKHSSGDLEQFFNIGFAALVGIALDEETNKLIIVNTCPGAGSCKVDCFAMKGGKIQFKAAWQSDGRILTYLLNDPDGFFNQLKSEIAKEERLGKKGGYSVSIRWHDAGDFFSPEYVDLAFRLANAFPNIKFYAYTKLADVVLGAQPENFIVNWSEGAHTSQEKKVKAADPNLERTKNSRIVPEELFADLLVTDDKGNLIKGADGQWQIIPEKLPELKQRLAKEYNVSINSIKSYNYWESITNGGKKDVPIKYNVIVAPGEPDISANTRGVLGTFLLKH